MTGLKTFLAALVALVFAGAAVAQDQAVLVADRISVQAGNQLRAEGNVEVLYKGARLRAAAITYNRSRDRITIEGPMSLAQGDGFILLADAGELDADFQNGLLTSARVVLDQQLQIAGAELRRVDGRYTQLFRAVASTCPVCSGSDTPLWQIRASRVIHDQQNRQVYYDNALFEVYGLPVFWVPRLRMPDASVTRATGFLIPRLKTSSVLGTGVQIPYFIALGDHADLTLDPYLSRHTTTLGFRHRQLFRKGAMILSGAVTEDDLLPGDLRGYLFGSGVFFLPEDFVLSFDLQMSSDKSYLFDYGISDQDRLRSDIELNRVKRGSYFSAQASNFRSFRDDEIGDAIPSQLGQVDYRKKFALPLVGGNAEYHLQAYGLARPSNIDITGRDYTRLTTGFDWNRDAVFGPCLQLTAQAQVNLDHYIIGQDSTTDGDTRLTSVGAVELGWPLIKRSQSGVVHLLEPRLQFVFSDAKATAIPNEESTLVEFDEGALWSLDRLPGSSSYEIGNRLNAGVTWTRRDPDGWSGALTVGRVLRDTTPTQFTRASGLQGKASDWLVAAQLDLGPEFVAANRLLLADDLSIDRNDTQIRWNPGNFTLDANFLWHVSEPEVGRDQDTWELHASAAFPLGRQWEGKANLRYDFVANRAASAGLVLTYKTQCITADFGFERTYTSSVSVTPKSDFTIALSVPPVAVASKRAKPSCSR